MIKSALELFFMIYKHVHIQVFNSLRQKGFNFYCKQDEFYPQRILCVDLTWNILQEIWVLLSKIYKSAWCLKNISRSQLYLFSDLFQQHWLVVFWGFWYQASISFSKLIVHLLICYEKFIFPAKRCKLCLSLSIRISIGANNSRMNSIHTY